MELSIVHIFKQSIKLLKMLFEILKYTIHNNSAKNMNTILKDKNNCLLES